MHLEEQEILLGHGLLIARQRVEHDDPEPVLLDMVANDAGEFAQGKLCRVDLAIGELPVLLELASVETEPDGSPLEDRPRLVEADDERLVPFLHCRIDVAKTKRGLAGTRGADDQGRRAIVEASADQFVKRGIVAAARLPLMAFVRMIAGHEAGENFEAPLADHEVVEAALELACAHLVHSKTPALGAIRQCELLEPHHTMGEAVQTEVIHGFGQIIEEQDRAAVLGEEMFEREHLTAKSERALGQQPDLLRLSNTTREGATRSTSSLTI